ncbi:hypothetical protein R1sor_022857 [Riccia sorocarpa]|uniref:Serine aminopeptidase S33 domain-containing protein n=1 Tax=Riccia sorocarpa TaxID=122646 RepID=A0ABD3GPZ1_9MARC
MEVIGMNHPHHHHHQHAVSAAASAVLVSSSSSRRISFVNVFSASREVTFPLRAIRTLALAITSLISFIPVWKLYLPGYWLSKNGQDSGNRLFKQGRSATGAAATAATTAAMKAYNEVNDPQVRRNLAQNLSHLLVGPLCTENWDSERQVRSFVNSRSQTVFTQSWLPVANENLRGVVILLHGLNEHSGRYAYFASKLNARGYGVFGMDWIGHGGSDGLHGYVESLDHVVHDTKLFVKQVAAEYPNVPLFIFGHSTGGAIALKTSVVLDNEPMLKGVILTSPAVRVRASHPLVAALAPIFSLILPRYQFKGASRSGASVSRDPNALLAKYSDPLVYTGPVRIRTGTEILRICSFLMKNLEKITTPFLVMHGSDDQVTDPEGSRELYSRASSSHKSIQIYDGLLHDLLFEYEKDDIIQDIIEWLDSRLLHV